MFRNKGKYSERAATKWIYGNRTEASSQGDWDIESTEYTELWYQNMYNYEDHRRYGVSAVVVVRFALKTDPQSGAVDIRTVITAGQSSTSIESQGVTVASGELKHVHEIESGFLKPSYIRVSIEGKNTVESQSSTLDYCIITYGLGTASTDLEWGQPVVGFMPVGGVVSARIVGYAASTFQESGDLAIMFGNFGNIIIRDTGEAVIEKYGFDLTKDEVGPCEVLEVSGGCESSEFPFFLDYVVINYTTVVSEYSDVEPAAWEWQNP
jgi:hypothetical protein